ncbi:MAG: exodeoxyribonuclease VII large subunit [Thiotrichales bacterium]|jgi:exodeoxyribonuclease VII large subunit|nr:exodeoxyribonuclease VII large subunit [Thiotrichales bacterium]MBT3613902.1 exodeoxyribonuclease VII large subunit [Thiotrichales bacterium]MBT3752978.1 exodeoxyribonuclease VII large subunit [Thiotrichales bacterium]MBT3836833.1 exodeoxyribonuclease VII large subunit [Thiotrichales bacterium]MBT4153000.1 exodeoxyribonuclease VII large subunit [Thiotrichales bacterium]
MKNNFTPKPVLSVSQLNRESRFLLENNLSSLWVEGEISNLARPASGHIYFTLKDEQAQIRCAMFRNRLKDVNFRPQNGMEIQLRGSVSIYEARGDYQLIVDRMKPGGEGVLQRSFEALKKRLDAEGLFDEEQKQLLPTLPTRVGVISSASGAAIHDILTVLKRRFPALLITIYPTSVQGIAAEGEIIAAIEQAQQYGNCDLLIISRGGGSLEDLWSFNEEGVARAIYNCTIPTISAVGHETDFTIADFVADQRAPTPSAAAEMISPDGVALQQQLTQFSREITREISSLLERRESQLKNLKVRLRHPRERIQQFAQHLDDIEQRLLHSGKYLFIEHNSRVENLLLRLHNSRPDHQIELLRQQLQNSGEQLNNSLRHKIGEQQEHLAGLAHALENLSPLSTLARGYSVTLDQDGVIVASVNSVESGAKISTRVRDGVIESKVF